MTGERPKKDVTEAVVVALDATDDWEHGLDEAEAERHQSRFEAALKRRTERGL